MSGNRVVYRNWIAETGVDPGKPRQKENWDDPLLASISLDEPSAVAISDEEVQRLIEDRKAIETVRCRVQKALERLSVQEREFIAQFYFMGKSYREISLQSGRPVYKLEALHKRAIKRLKKELSPFVRERFGIEANVTGNCPICQSPHVAEIDRLIGGRGKAATWKPIIERLRENYGLRITSPQVLIGHEKYHRRSLSKNRRLASEGSPPQL